MDAKGYAALVTLSVYISSLFSPFSSHRHKMIDAHTVLPVESSDKLYYLRGYKGRIYGSPCTNAYVLTYV
jgi:hypothetical protein